MQSYLLVLLILLFTLIVPGLITIFIITHQQRKNHRYVLNDQDTDHFDVSFSINGKDYQYPLLNISRSGLAFDLKKIPKSLITSEIITMKICSHNQQVMQIDSWLVHLKAQNGKYIAGAKFKQIIDQDDLLILLNHNVVQLPQTQPNKQKMCA